MFIMNNLYVILSLLVIYTGIVKCNFNSSLSAERAATYCYYCSNCPRPFNPYSSYVSQVYSPTGRCVMMSTSSSVGAVYTLGAAQPSLCNWDGCTWQSVSGIRTWVCCCSQNLCNTGTPTTTTARPFGTTCYYCSTCPRPFSQYSTAVSQTYSSTGWCTKMSSSSSVDAVYTRGSAQPGLCSWNGCIWQIVNGVNTWVCCCNRYLCNTAVSTSQSIAAVLSAALMTTVFTCNSF